MNVYATTKQDFIKFNNVRELFRELYNICLLFKETEHWYYCNCRKLRPNRIKCTLCKFDDAFDDKSYERFLITHRNNPEKLQKIVDIYWNFIQQIKKEDQSALDFFNKEYVWTFRDYRQHIDLRSTLDEIIEHNEELISSNGLEKFLENFV